MRLARALAAREKRVTALELAAGPAGEHDDLVVVGVVRLHVHESICLLRHWNLPSSPVVAANVPRDLLALQLIQRERAYAGSRTLTRNGAVAAKPTAMTSAPATASKM